MKMSDQEEKNAAQNIFQTQNVTGSYVSNTINNYNDSSTQQINEAKLCEGKNIFNVPNCLI